MPKISGMCAVALLSVKSSNIRVFSLSSFLHLRFSMAKNLLDLPLEVLLNITSHLDTPSYGRLRLVSSAMEKSTFDAFAGEFFGTKQFMITTFSLSTLLEISRHQTLSKYVYCDIKHHRAHSSRWM